MQSFAGDLARRDGPFLDRPDRLAREAVEHVGKAGLRYLRDGLDRPAVDDDIDQIGRRGDVVVPDAVMHGLEVPDSLPGFGIERDQAFGVDILAVAHTAPVVVGRRGYRQIDDSRFVVGGHEGPDVCVAGSRPGAVFPGLVIGFAGLGNRVETPFEFAGVGVVGANVARRTAISHDVVEDLRADDDAAADGDGRRTVGDVVHLEFEPAEIAAQVDEAVVAEIRVRLAGFDIYGN